MRKCRHHPLFKGIVKPRRTKAHPEGCPLCWEVYSAVGQKAVEEERKPRATKKTVASAMDRVPALKGLTAKKLKIEIEATGEYALMYGRRCLFVAPDMDSVEAFVTGFREGLQYVHHEGSEA